MPAGPREDRDKPLETCFLLYSFFFFFLNLGLHFHILPIPHPTYPPIIPSNPLQPPLAGEFPFLSLSSSIRNPQVETAGFRLQRNRKDTWFHFLSSLSLSLRWAGPYMLASLVDRVSTPQLVASPVSLQYWALSILDLCSFAAANKQVNWKLTGVTCWIIVNFYRRNILNKKISLKLGYMFHKNYMKELIVKIKN